MSTTFSSGWSRTSKSANRRKRLTRAVQHVVERLEDRCLLSGALAGEVRIDAGATYQLHFSPGYPAAASYKVSWGEPGAEPESISPAGGELNHVYAQAGAYRPAVISYDAQGVEAGRTALGLDPGFGQNGFVFTSFSQIDPPAAGAQHVYTEGSAVRLQKDGKFIVSGPSYRADGAWDYGVARYNPDGSLDSSLGGAGKFTANFGGAIPPATLRLALARNGKIYVIGAAGAAGAGTDFAVARYNADGTPDLSFGQSGWTRVDIRGHDDTALAAAEQRDGSLLLAGSAADGA